MYINLNKIIGKGGRVFFTMGLKEEGQQCYSRKILFQRILHELTSWFRSPDSLISSEHTTHFFSITIQCDMT